MDVENKDEAMEDQANKYQDEIFRLFPVDLFLNETNRNVVYDYKLSTQKHLTFSTLYCEQEKKSEDVNDKFLANKDIKTLARKLTNYLQATMTNQIRVFIMGAKSVWTVLRLYNLMCMENYSYKAIKFTVVDNNKDYIEYGEKLAHNYGCLENFEFTCVNFIHYDIYANKNFDVALNFLSGAQNELMSLKYLKFLTSLPLVFPAICTESFFYRCEDLLKHGSMVTKIARSKLCRIFLRNQTEAEDGNEEERKYNESHHNLYVLDRIICT